jgi:aromatic ring-cleaving dioxygenase
MPSEHDIIYLAGFIDGDGCFFIGKFKTKKGTTHYHTQLNLTNTNKEVIEWIREKFGGSSWKQVRHHGGKLRPYEREVYQVNVTGENLTILIECIIPHLIVKKPQAEIMLRMRRTYCRNRSRGSAAVSDVDNAIRQECYEAIRKINSRFALHPLKTS